MPRYVIDAPAALRLAADATVVDAADSLVAPALLKSQVLSQLYQAVARGDLTREDASRRLDYLRGLRIRYLSDRVSQATAWKLADALGLPDTLPAEYIAVTQLQADALIALDPALAEAASGTVRVATLADLR
ncbi:hypothetical protein [Leifsonia sp. NCR5]|uniref:hypothetical protein n=1 Tax=Leifsonia sp. NCR5 TaxID=1978342 RepID=UPI000A18A943|nr:hypothetical protein [Leifsonia sp. NCR5]